MDHGDKLATVTYLSERIAAVAAVPREEADVGFERVSNVAMHALARRGMSSAELRTYLVGREFPTDVADIEVERLESVGLLDDLHLAETLVRTLRERKGLGRSGLKSELSRRRLDPDAIAAALESIEGDETGAALELAHKRAAQLRTYDAQTAKRRLIAFLQRKGYSTGVAARAAQIALGTPSAGSSSSGPAFR